MNFKMQPNLKGMATRFIKKKKEDIGLSPFELVFRGEKLTEKLSVQVLEFDDAQYNEYTVETLDQLKDLKTSEKFFWINVDGLHDNAFLEGLAGIFSIPFNIISDIMNPSLRPKVEEFDDGVFLTIKTMDYKEDEELLSVENLSLIFFNHVIISFKEQTSNIFDPVKDRIYKHKNKIRTAGADYLAFAILDVVVDNYIYIVGMLGDNIETIEESMTSNPRSELLEDINKLKKAMNVIRKNIKPAKEMIFTLSKLPTELIDSENKMHYKELQDNISEANELADSYREILYDQLTIYHTIMSTKLNDIMRILTVYSVIFIPLTFIVGVYGTNFKYIPELDYRYGYPIMWAVMVVLSIILIIYFKKKKWL